LENLQSLSSSRGFFQGGTAAPTAPARFYFLLRFRLSLPLQIRFQVCVELFGSPLGHFEDTGRKKAFLFDSLPEHTGWFLYLYPRDT
jgi:hypothetical protein